MDLAPRSEVSVDRGLGEGLLLRKAVTWKGRLGFFLCLLTEHLISY